MTTSVTYSSSSSTLPEPPFSGGERRFSFNGKEKDCETGFSYFGARYYDAELTTMWLSVDPMADKYPGISPYAYCAWNPVKLIDPDGCDTIRLDLSSGNISRNKADGNHSVEYYRNGENVGSLEIDKDICEFGFSSVNYTSKDGDGSPFTTQYLLVGNLAVGEEIFKKVSDLGSDVEWDYHTMKNESYGELSTSSQSNKMVHSSGRHTRKTVSQWRHYHPQNSSDSPYPSYSDQNKAKNLGVPCYIHSQSKSMQFDNILPSKGHITISQFNRLWNSFAR